MGSQATLMDSFTAAASDILGWRQPLENHTLLYLYGLYKFTYCGQCTTPKPSPLNPKERAKWDSWTRVSQSGMSQSQAMLCYVDAVEAITGRRY